MFYTYFLIEQNPFFCHPATFNQKDQLQELKVLFQNRSGRAVNNEEATTALVNYFAEIGSSDENINIDYDFIEQLLITAGQ